jgi:hypothetical protein
MLACVERTQASVNPRRPLVCSDASIRLMPSCLFIQASILEAPFPARCVETEAVQTINRQWEEDGFYICSQQRQRTIAVGDAACAMIRVNHHAAARW